MSTNGKQVIIVGGGVIGAACAYYLSKFGWDVTIVEAGEFGKGCSHGNCGLICPSHVLPLAAPGAVSKTLKRAFKRHSPLHIKPRFDLALWLWLLKFVRRCRTEHMIQAGRARAALLNSAMALYRELLNDEPIDCEWETRGCLFVYQSQSEMDTYAKTDTLLCEQFDLPASRYDGSALVELEPALKPGLAGAWHYAMDAHLRPDTLMASWRRVLEDRGTTVREQCEVKGFIRAHGRARAIKTSAGDMPADAFVVATGALTPLLDRHLGCRRFIQPGKGYSITMPRPARCPAIPLIFPEQKVVATPMQSGYRLGSTLEFAGYDTTLNRCRLDALTRGASHYLDQPNCDPVQEEWYGWRPMTYDGKPIIDRSPVMENVYVAAGHSMIGMATAPATGKLVAELLAGQQPHIDPRPYSISRS